MTDMITRCPSCATSFRITEAQLQTAKGAVRCGSCLHIFRALENLVPAKGQSQPQPPAKKTVGTAAPPDSAVKKPAADPESKPSTATANPTTAAKKSAAASSPLTTKFEYKRPSGTGAAPAKPPTTQKKAAAGVQAKAGSQRDSTLPSAAVENEHEEIDIENAHFTAEMGQENMLRFDQQAIDASDESIDEEELLISDDMADDDDDASKPKSKMAYGDDLSESFLDLSGDSWKPKEKSLFDREIKTKDDDDDNKESADESWAVSLLEDMDDDDDTNDFVQPPAPEEKHDSPVGEYSRDTTGTFTALDDNDIEDALGAPLGEASNKRGEDRISYKDHLTDDDTARPSTNNVDQMRALMDDDYDSGDDYENDLYAEPEDRASLLSSIEPEPVEMAWAGGNFNWRRKLFYAATVTAGVLLLLIQVAWLQFDSLSRKQPFRDWYAGVCPLLGCEVPSMSARTSIRTYNLIVRSHPDTNDALMVDTILLNTAPFKQPFPDLVLSFSNIQGEVLAARTFAPEDYLGGELAGKTEMPIGQPVHLSLEIVDPGPEAVNYTAYIP